MLEWVKYSSFIVSELVNCFIEQFSIRWMVPKTKGNARFFSQIIFFKFSLVQRVDSSICLKKVTECPGIVLQFHIQLNNGNPTSVLLFLEFTLLPRGQSVHPLIFCHILTQKPRGSQYWERQFLNIRQSHGAKRGTEQWGQRQICEPLGKLSY